MLKSFKNNSNFNVERTENGTVVSFLLPTREPSEADVMTPNQVRAVYMDIIGVFSQRIIASLERRMEACRKKLFEHLATAFTDPHGIQIGYMAGNRLETFNMPSYKAMEDCITALQSGAYGDVIECQAWVDQIVKALLNDTEQDHSDAGQFKYSQLVSMLASLHMYGFRCEY